MSQPPQASSQASEHEIQELLGEIAFQKVLLESIDDTVKNREAAEREVKEEIRQLERQLRVLKYGTTSKASQSGSSQSQQLPSSSFAQATPSNGGKAAEKRPAKSSPEDETTFASIMDNSINRDQSSASSMPSTPKSADSLDDLVTPSRMNLPSRKRSHSTHLDGALNPPQDTKSRRTSPSPFMTGPTTPSSVISSGDDEFESFARQLAVDQQKSEEQAIQQMKSDQELARTLQFESHAQSASSSSSSTQAMTQNNAFNRMSGMRPPPPTFSIEPPTSSSAVSSSSKRTLPWSTNIKAEAAVKAEPRSMTSGIKHEPQSTAAGFSQYASMQNNRPTVKSEASSSRPIPGAFPRSFRDDSSAASDSDIEIIPSTAFHDNGRYSRPMGNYNPQQNVKRSPESVAAGNAALGRLSTPQSGGALSMGLFNRKQPSWATGNSETPIVGKNEFVYSSNLHNPGPVGYTMNNIPVYDGSLAGPPNAFGQATRYVDPLGAIISRSGNQNLDEISQHLGLDASINGRLDYIINDPRKTDQEIRDLLENIRPDEEVPPESREGTPDGLVYPLYEHQKLALTWLKAMEEGKNKGGILADDMGLGKTISSLALILSRPSTDKLCKTTLIVGPVALVRQWDREIKKKVKVSHRLSTYMVHGQKRAKQSWDELRLYDVILTTYGTLAAEYKRLEKFLEERKNQTYDEAPMRKSFPLLGPKSVFYRVLLDEAQYVKNKATQSAKAVCHIHAKYRFCLTGTPMMNNVGELYSLIHFLRIRPYNEWGRFQEAFGMLTKDARRHYDKENAMKKLRVLLKAILLRRNKTSLIDGKPIISLPPKTEEIQHVVFDEDEKTFYQSLETQTQIKFSKYLKAGTVGKNYSNVLVLLLRLRQACCHPHLIQDFEEAPSLGGADADAMIALAKSLAPEVVARLLAAEDAFTCPVCYDAIPNPRIVTPCGHDTCSECLAKIVDSVAYQNVANGEEGRAHGKCPSCRGELAMNKVIDYVSFKKVHKPDDIANEDDDDEDVTASENSDSEESEAETESEDEDDANSDGDLRNFIVPDDVDDEIDDDTTEGEEGDDEADQGPKSKGKGKAAANSKSSKKSTGKSKRHPKDKKGKGKEKKVHISIAMLKKEATKTKAGRKRYMKYLKKNWQPSAKVTKCVELLDQFSAEGHKTIVFSQFVSLLDLLQVPINEKRFKCLRYDGGMSADERHDAVVQFTDSKDYNIMLISLKAGNAGLNLVAASRVIILDPFWNPYIEMQAVDRAYRIGQQQEVQVHRILIEGTVEDRIITLQEQKRKLVEAALDEGAGKAVGALNVQQLAFLFGVRG